MGTSVGSLFVDLTLNVATLSQGVNRANAEISNFTRKTEAALQNMGKAVLGYLTFDSVVAGVQKAFIEFSEFERQVKLTGSVANATNSQLKDLAESARQLAGAFDAKELVGSQYSLASAGQTVSQIMDTQVAVMVLAQATQSDLASTSETLASTLSQFSLKADEATRVANVFAAAISNSQATMPKLSDSMRYAGPIAAQLGMDLETTVASLMLLYDAGLRGEQAGTSLRQAMLKLQDPTDEMTRIFAALGVEINNADGTTRPFMAVMQDLAGKNMDAGVAAKLFGQESAAAMLILASGIPKLEELKTKISGTNEAFVQSSKQMDALWADSKKLWNATSDLAISYGEKLSPALRSVIQDMTQILNIKLGGTFEDIKIDNLNLLNQMLAESRARLEKLREEATTSGQWWASIFSPVVTGALIADANKRIAELEAKIAAVSMKAKEGSDGVNSYAMSLIGLGDAGQKAATGLSATALMTANLNTKALASAQLEADKIILDSKQDSVSKALALIELEYKTKKIAIEDSSKSESDKATELAALSITTNAKKTAAVEEYGRKAKEVNSDLSAKITELEQGTLAGALASLELELTKLREQGASKELIHRYGAQKRLEIERNTIAASIAAEAEFTDKLRDAYKQDADEAKRRAEEKARINFDYYKELSDLSNNTTAQLKLDAVSYFTKWLDLTGDQTKAYDLTLAYIKDKTKTELEKTLEDWGNWSKQIQGSINDLALDTRDALADSISGSLQGEFDSTSEALDSFKENFLDSVSDLVAKALAQFALLTTLDFTGLGSLLGGLGKTSTSGIDLSSLMTGYGFLKGAGNSGEYLANLLDAVSSGATAKEAAEFASLTSQGTSAGILASLGTSVKSLVSSIGEGVSSLFSSSMAGADGASMMGEALGSIGQTVEGIQSTTAAVNGLTSGVTGMAAGVGAFIAVGSTIASMLNASQDTSPEEARAIIAANAEEVNRLSAVMAANSETTGLFEGAISELVDEMYKMADRAGVGRASIDDLVASLDPLASGAANVGAHLADVTNQLFMTTNSIRDLAETSWGMAQGIDAVQESLSGYIDGLGLSSELTEMLRDSATTLIDQFQTGQLTIEALSQQLNDVFVSALDGSLESVNALGEAIGGLQDKTVTVTVLTEGGVVIPAASSAVDPASGLSDLVSYFHGGGWAHTARAHTGLWADELAPNERGVVVDTSERILAGFEVAAMGGPATVDALASGQLPTILARTAASSVGSAQQIMSLSIPITVAADISNPRTKARELGDEIWRYLKGRIAAGESLGA